MSDPADCNGQDYPLSPMTFLVGDVVHSPTKQHRMAGLLHSLLASPEIPASPMPDGASRGGYSYVNSTVRNPARSVDQRLAPP